MSIKSKFDLSGKVAIVTGASKGIGESMAEAFAEAGATVVVSSRKQEAVDEVAKNIEEQGGTAKGIAANTGSMDDLQNLVDQTIEAFGGVDIIVNNAATNPVFGPVINTNEDAFDKIMNVNVKGPFELSKKAFASMKKRGGGMAIMKKRGGGMMKKK